MDKKLLEYCTTDRQKQIIQCLVDGHSYRQTARLVGISAGTVSSHINTVKTNAARQGYAPDHNMTKPAPDGFTVKGVSTLYDEDGNPKAQWVKTNQTQEDQLNALKAALDEFLVDHDGKSPKIPAPKSKLKNQEIAIINIGDAHFGMYAHNDISGDNYDTKIAAKRHKDVFDRLMINAPDCETCIINQLGDYFHADNYEGFTARSKHALDTDGRLEHVFLIGLEVMTYMTSEALKRFKKVIVRHCRGNHDDILSMAIKAHQQAWWRSEKRLEVAMSPAPTWVYQHGKSAFLVTHGHAPKPAKLAEYFAAKYPEIWGATKHRYCYHGHIHSKNTAQETYGGCITESFAGLPPADSWHNEQGYVSGQSMCLIVLDKDKGEVRRSTERV